jgi:hypothetical protein
MLITIKTPDGPRKVNVCDYCRTVCIPWPQRYCSGYCSQEDWPGLDQRRVT